MNKKGINNPNYRHGLRHHKLYSIWAGIKQRCTNINFIHYKDYGGRGIIYDPKWDKFENFFKDMYFKYLYATKQLHIKNPSIERINNDGNYCFENCIFIERRLQTTNTRKNKWFIAKSPIGKIFKIKNQREFARQHKLEQTDISKCLLGKHKTHLGWKFYFVRLNK